METRSLYRVFTVGVLTTFVLGLVGGFFDLPILTGIGIILNFPLILLGVVALAHDWREN